MAHDKVLGLLRILERDTSRRNPIRKEKLLNCAEREFDIRMDDKTFHSCIGALKDAGFPVESTTGRNAMYFYDRQALSGEQLTFLCTLVSASPELSETEAADLCRKLLREWQYPYTEELERLLLPLWKSPEHSGSIRLDRFATLIEAMRRQTAVRFKLRLSETDEAPAFSGWQTAVPQSLQVRGGKTEVVFASDGKTVTYAFGNLYDLYSTEF